MSAPDVRVYPEVSALMQAAADELVRIASFAITARGRFTVALSGGSTPAALYKLLAREPYVRQLDWSRVYIFFGDERCVPPDDVASNYRMARTALLDHVPIPAPQIYRMHGEDDPRHAAQAYEAALRAIGDPPRFDLVLLGLGPDGHTASLFPGTAAVREARRWVVAHYVAAQSSWRITLTPVVIKAAREVMFLVAGKDKAPALRRVLHGPIQPDVLPAQVVAPRDGRLIWLVDAEAGEGIKGSRDRGIE